ncbi:autotransporter-associated beta strand repeat-containing protein [Porphyrobacter sp. CACIAM 03H1]|uniref:autotransporter-associated beta strand repeat-containing protein n=1 Tax=Porphyrobacter sp. CACIAM 03H1 TaxID=2003315 RepID=UPI000B5A6403|nr:autotransporter-associated beta strand repeat-containing protein [Porphyrobacter sp. CACIAM 03H1]ASJ92090.1 hypothetical protein CBR61_14900 [Porphyrobacter sp. CACIAM 03H1]
MSWDIPTSSNTLQIGNGGTTGSLGTGNIVNNAALVFNRSNDATFGNLISGSGSLTKRGGGTLTLTGNLSQGSVQIDGGTLALSGTNTFTGGITVAGGTLRLASNGAAGGATGVIRTTGSVIDYANGVNMATPIVLNSSTTQLQVLSGSATQSGVISEIGGARPLEKIGAGNLRLTAANTYSGLTTVSAGTLTITNSGALGTAAGGTTVNSGATLEFNGAGVGIGDALTISGTGNGGIGALRFTYSGSPTFDTAVFNNVVSLAANATITFTDRTFLNSIGGFQLGSSTLTVVSEGAGNSTIRMTGAISGTGGIIQEGNGLLELIGNNTFTGPVTVNGGDLLLEFGAAVADSVAISMAAGTRLFVVGSETIGSLSGAGALRLSSNGTLTTGGNNASTTLSGNVSGNGSITKVGTGTFTLTGANSAVGTTTISGGTLQIGNGGTTGSLCTGNVVNNAALVFNRSNDLTVGNIISGTGTLTKQGAGVLTLTGANTYTGTTTINDGTLVIGTGGRLGSGNVVNNSLLTFNSADAITVANTISGTGRVFQTGSGTLTLTGDNSYALGTLLSAGNLVVGSNTALGTGLLTTLGGTLQLGIETTPGVSAGPITLGNRIELLGNTIVDLVGDTAGVNAFTGLYDSAGTSATLNGVISGTGRMTFVGAGTLTLNGNNTLSGGMSFGQALVQIGHANAFGTGSVVLESTAGLRNTSGGALTIGNNIAATGIGNTIGGTADLTLLGNLSGNGVLSKVQGGTLSINGDVNDFVGGLIINGGTVLVNGTMGNAGAAVVVGSGGTLGGTGTIAGSVNVNSGGTLAAGQSPGTITIGTLTLNAGSNTIFELAQAGVAGGPNNDLIRVTGNLALNGGSISIVRGVGFGAGQYTLFEFGSQSGLLGNLTLNPLGGGFAGSLALGANTVLMNVAGAADQVHWNGSTLAPTGAIVGGSGTWDLTSSNFSNATGTVSGPWAGNGALAIFGGATGGTVTIAADTVLSPSGLRFQTNGYVIAGASAGSGLALAGPTGIETTAGSGATIAVGISGAGSLTKTGPGTLTLTGANTYAGNTSVVGGTLQIGNGGTSGTLGGGNVLNDGALVFNRANDITVANVISGSGTLTKLGAGTLTLSGANTYTGSTTVAAGTLQILAGGSLASGVINSANLTNAGTISGFVVNSGVLGSTGVLGRGLANNATGSAFVSGQLIGTVINAGSITLTGTTTGIADVSQNGGTFNLNGFDTTIQSLAGSGGTLALGSATLTITGTGFPSNTFDGTITGTGSLIKNGPSAFSLSGAQSYTGLTTINGGSLIIGAAESLAGAVQNNAGFGNAGTIAGLVTNAGTLSSTGTLAAGLTNTAGARANVRGSVNGVITNAGTVSLMCVTTGITTLSQSATGVTNLFGFNTAVDALSGGGTVTLGSAILTVGGTSSSSTFGGTITGSGGLTKVGTGTLTLSGANTYTGATRIEGGTLALGANNVIANGSAVQIAGGTLALGTFADTVASVDLSAGSITGGPGSALGVTGDYVQSGGTLATGATVNVGTSASGVIRLSGGTIAGTLNGARAGVGAGIVNGGSVLVTGGMALAGNLNVGTTGTGTLNITGGGIVGNAQGWIGESAGSVGTVNVAGAGSRWDNSSSLIVGFSGTGVLRISDGGIVTAAGGVAGLNAGSDGTLSVSGAGSRLVIQSISSPGLLSVGDAGNGRLELTDGGEILSVNSSIGRLAGGRGSALVSGAGSRWTTSATFFVGGFGEGTLDIVDGGQVASSSAVIGVPAGANGTARVSGIGSRWDASGSISLGNIGTGTLTISDRGAVSGASMTIASDARGTGTLIFGAAEGSAAVAAGTLTTPTIAMGPGAASIIFNHAAADFELAAAISGTGTLRQLAGVTTLSGASTFTGLTSVLGGTLRVTGSLASDVLIGGATLENTGTIGGLVTNNGTLVSTGTLGGGLVNAGGATARISGVLAGAVDNSGTIALTGATSGGAALTQSVTGTLDLAGNSLELGSLAGEGSVRLGSGTLTTGGDDSSTTFAGVISGSGGLVKTGSGIFTLSGVNTFTGLTTVSAGTLAIGAGAALAGGASNAATLTNAGTIAGAVSNTGSLTNTGTIGGLVTNGGTLVSTGTLGGGLVNAGGATAQIAGVVSGAVSNGGTITLTGTTTGIGAVTQLAGGVFDLAGFSTTIGSLAGEGSVRLGSGTLTTGGDDSSTTFAGVISGNGGLVKTGSGTFTLVGANSFTGLTTVSAGTLAIGASGALAGAVLNNATLANAGSIAGAVTNTAVFSNTGSVAGLVTSSGTLTNGGTLGGGLANLVGGNASNTGSIAGGVTNAGTLANSGTIGGLVTNNGTLASTGTLGGGLVNAGGATAQIAGVVTGTVSNGGTITLTGTTTGIGAVTQVAGGVFDLAGFSTTIGSLAGDGSVRLGSGTLTTGGDDSSTTFAGVISGSGGLVKTGSGIFTLSGVNTFTGLTTVSAGTLAIGAGAALAGGASNAATLTNAGTIAGAVGNTGSLSNTGTIGGLVTNGGTLVSTGTLGGGLVNAGGATAQISGVVSGAVSNGGTITLTGTTTGITGLVQVAGGRFDLAGFATTLGGLSGEGAVLLGSGDLTVDTGAGSTRFAGVISGSGGLTKRGAQTLALAGANTFTGLVTVSGGTLLVETGGSLASAVLNNADLANGGTIAGLVTNNGTFLTAGRVIGGLVNNGSVQLAGQIDGAVTNNGRITNIGGAMLLGRFTQAAGGSLNLSGFSSSLGSLAGGGTIALGSATLFVGGDNSSSTFAGVISGSGGLVKTGSGTFTLDGVNTYTGTNFVNAGTLVVGSGAAVVPVPAAAPAAAASGAASGDVVPAVAAAALRPALSAGASELSGGPALVTLGRDGAMTTSALATVDLSAPAIDVLTAPAAGAAVPASTTLSAAVIAGSVVNNAVLVNNGTILGQVSNAAGASARNQGVIAGTVFNDGSLVSTGTLGRGLVNNGTAQIAGVLNGDVVNAGRIDLTGATTGIAILEQAAGGSFNLAGFDTRVGAISGAGAIILGNARLTTGTDGIATLFGGVISGTGGLTKVGTGRLVLTGTNTYTGGTTISGGVLQLGNGGTTGAIAGPVVNNGALVINRSDAFTFANVISGTGIFVQDGTGTTTLTGANTYRGGTLVSRGRLVGNTVSLQGLIENNAALEFAQTSAGTFAGSLVGTGVFDKTGAGLLTLTGNSNGFTGGTFVRAGELRVTGGLAGSRVTVLSGATLSGSGTIGGLTANSGSIIAHGADGPGVLGVNGAVNLQAGSTLQLQIRANGLSDAIVSNGAASLGGTAAFTNLGGVYAFNSEIVLLQADGGRTGTFNAATGFAGFGILYRPELVYTATQARLRMAPNLLANIVGSTPLTANQRSVVNRIDGAVTAGYNPQPLFNVYALPTAQLPGAFDQLSGEIYATAAGVGMEQERLVREAVLGRVNTLAMAARGAPEAGQGAGAWAQLFGGWGDGDGDGNAARFEADRMGFATGIDFGNANENGSWRAGLFGLRIQSDVTIDARGSSAEVQQSGGGAYAAISTGGLTATVGGYLAEVDLRAFRSIALPGFAEDNVGTTEGRGRQAFAELSYTLTAGKSQFRPFVGGAIGSFRLDALTERGGAAALAMTRQRYSTGSVTAGVDAMVPVGKRLDVLGTLAGRAQLGDRDPRAQLALAAAPQQGFAIEGVQLDKFALAARLEARLKLEDNLEISAGYNGLIGSTITDHGARATVQVRF